MARPKKKVKTSAKKAKLTKTTKSAKSRTLKASKKLPKKTKSRTTTVRKEKVSAIPKGYSNITPHLIVGNGAEAIEFYKNAFNAKEVLRLERPDDKITHAELKIGDTKFMVADEWPEMEIIAPQNSGNSAISIHLYVKNADKIIESALNAGAKLIKAAEDKFYGDRLGIIEDISGHRWSIATRIENVSKAQLRKRQQKMLDQQS